MGKFFTKFVLPNPVDFIRYVHGLIYLNHKEGKDTITEVDPVVTRAKNLVGRKSVILTQYERKDK